MLADLLANKNRSSDIKCLPIFLSTDLLAETEHVTCFSADNLLRNVEHVLSRPILLAEIEHVPCFSADSLPKLVNASVLLVEWFFDEINR